jgi:UDP-N-acetylglucosamine 2-epimerase
LNPNDALNEHNDPNDPKGIIKVNEVSDVPSVAFTDANENLKKEGIPEEKIFLVGNVMVDSLLFNLEIPNYRCLALTPKEQVS